MAKVSFNAINDEFPERKPTIRDIQPTKRKKPLNSYTYPPVRNSGSKFKKAGWVFLGLGVLLVLATVFVVLLMGKTDINLKVREASVTLSDDVIREAYRTPEENELPFVVFEEEATESVLVPATEKKYVEQKASGKLVVYNKFKKGPQKIIKNTRFEAPDGKIYRVRNSFIIPGYKVVDGKIVPGKTEIIVYADEAGEGYNKESAKFTLPGLKGDPRYDKIWAETKTPLSGGFKGTKPVVSEVVREQESQKLEVTLADKLYNKLKARLADKYVVFKDSLFIDYQLNETVKDDEGVELQATGRAKAIVFPMNSFADFILVDSGEEYSEGDKTVINTQELTFAFIQKDEIDPDVDEVVKFTISGTAKIRWNLDKDKFIQGVLGKPEDEFDAYASSNPAVVDHSYKLRPIWRSTFPTNPENIRLNIEFVEK